MTTSNGLDHTEWARAPEKSGTRFERIMRAIYNPEEKSFLGRTAKRWGIVLAFYAVFYAVLVAMFAACMFVLLATLDDNVPTYLLDKSRIGSNPGVSFRPTAYDGKNDTVKFEKNDQQSYSKYINQLKEYVKADTILDYDSTLECTSETDNFGYPETPCFFIKLNRIIKWEPDYYKVSELPPDAGALTTHIEEEDGATDKVWVSCEPEDSTMNVTFKYPWVRGFPKKAYPYIFSKDTQVKVPLVAVKIDPKPEALNKEIAIRCRVWAKNIPYNKSKKEPSGYTRFMLHIQDNASAKKSESSNPANN